MKEEAFTMTRSEAEYAGWQPLQPRVQTLAGSWMDYSCGCRQSLRNRPLL